MKKLIYIPFLILAIIGCSSEPSLQKYMAANSENSNFIAIDLGADVLKINKKELNQDEKDALKAFKKLNIIAFKKTDDNDALYKKEKEEVQHILKENSQYEQLMRFGSGTQGMSIYAVGKGEDFDEFILFGNQNETGFVIVRVLGKKMNPTQIMNFMSMLQKSDFDQEQLKPLIENFTGKHTIEVQEKQV